MSVLGIPKSEIPKLRRRLLTWFTERRRDLPWRRTSDPYRIWISEIMLQQTRVVAVIPYYEKFLKKFPTMHALARARSETVLGNWAGLGYYSRARNLHLAAKKMIARHAGHFPRDYGAALDLPGVGRYTAAAVLSIAYDQPHAVLDGNVARVLARIGAVRGDLRAPLMWRKLEKSAQDLLARKAPGDWNQAMMELGATVCTPKSPQCGECPVSYRCEARKLGIAEKIPVPRKKQASQDVILAAAVLLDPEGRTLLVRQINDDGALFSRMWQFPAVEAHTDAAADLGQYLRNQFVMSLNENLTALKNARHTVTFRKIRLVPFVIRVPSLPHVEGARTAVLGNFGNLPISNATRKISNLALHHLEESPNS